MSRHPTFRRLINKLQQPPPKAPTHGRLSRTIQRHPRVVNSRNNKQTTINKRTRKRNTNNIRRSQLHTIHYNQRLNITQSQRTQLRRHRMRTKLITNGNRVNLPRTSGHQRHHKPPTIRNKLRPINGIRGTLTHSLLRRLITTNRVTVKNNETSTNRAHHLNRNGHRQPLILSRTSNHVSRHLFRVTVIVTITKRPHRVPSPGWSPAEITDTSTETTTSNPSIIAIVRLPHTAIDVDEPVVRSPRAHSPSFSARTQTSGYSAISAGLTRTQTYEPFSLVVNESHIVI